MRFLTWRLFLSMDDGSSDCGGFSYSPSNRSGCSPYDVLHTELGQLVWCLHHTKIDFHAWASPFYTKGPATIHHGFVNAPRMHHLSHTFSRWFSTLCQPPKIPKMCRAALSNRQPLSMQWRFLLSQYLQQEIHHDFPLALIIPPFGADLGVSSRPGIARSQPPTTRSTCLCNLQFQI